MIAQTPEPPYYAVIFTNLLTEQTDGYDETADRMVELASNMPGYLGHESARDGIGITISYWDSETSIKKWKMVGEHQLAQKAGIEKWYQQFCTRVCKVERDHHWEK
ncbi:MAG: antibiotic biosynthesis monooxygenase [Cyclobacteriaceae bacterium]